MAALSGLNLSFLAHLCSQAARIAGSLGNLKKCRFGSLLFRIRWMRFRQVATAQLRIFSDPSWGESSWVTLGPRQSSPENKHASLFMLAHLKNHSMLDKQLGKSQLSRNAYKTDLIVFGAPLSLGFPKVAVKFMGATPAWHIRWISLLSVLNLGVLCFFAECNYRKQYPEMMAQSDPMTMSQNGYIYRWIHDKMTYRVSRSKVCSCYV